MFFIYPLPSIGILRIITSLPFFQNKKRFMPLTMQLLCHEPLIKLIWTLKIEDRPGYGKK